MLEKNQETKNSDHEAQFPIGMRVMAIDANIVSLRLLVALLQKCQYQVTATTDATDALKILMEEKDKFDIVITDVVRPDMDGFRLLEIISLETDLPVLMISANDDKKNVIRGIRNGAVCYLLKPVRIEQIKNIWQHVIRKRIQRGSAKQTLETTSIGGDPTSARCNDASSSRKKPRLRWTTELHSKFMDAIQQLRPQAACPSRILEIMNVPGLTRENVASHLQKYRNTLKKAHASKMSQHISNKEGEDSLNGEKPNTSIERTHETSDQRRADVSNATDPLAPSQCDNSLLGLTHGILELMYPNSCDSFTYQALPLNCVKAFTSQPSSLWMVNRSGVAASGFAGSRMTGYSSEKMFQENPGNPVGNPTDSAHFLRTCCMPQRDNLPSLECASPGVGTPSQHVSLIQTRNYLQGHGIEQGQNENKEIATIDKHANIEQDITLPNMTEEERGPEQGQNSPENLKTEGIQILQSPSFFDDDLIEICKLFGDDVPPSLLS